jgi:hypothetical protein
MFESADRQVSVGHGVGLVATPLINFVLGLLIGSLGRVLLRWRAIEW